jgi:glycine dehydrogenase
MAARSPHGGGGPGVGPICVAEHLAPFLPGHDLVKTGGSQAIDAVASAPFGSASILVISWSYIKMLGGVGLSDSPALGILHAAVQERQGSRRTRAAH